MVEGVKMMKMLQPGGGVFITGQPQLGPPIAWGHTLAGIRPWSQWVLVPAGPGAVEGKRGGCLV